MTETKSSIPGSAEVWITGIGLATSLGEGLDANWDALNQRRINVDEKSLAPYVVHPWAPVNFDTQIPKKGDQRQMEAWQRIGTYAAGLALDSAGVKGNQEILGRMDMIVAAGGGERDLAVDTGILQAEAKGNSAPGFLNERLMNDLRPTLFLAQLSNLLAGNIAIVHGVTGSSRTFMGEEAAGIDAARIALARIAGASHCSPSTNGVRSSCSRKSRSCRSAASWVVAARSRVTIGLRPRSASQVRTKRATSRAPAVVRSPPITAPISSAGSNGQRIDCAKS